MRCKDNISRITQLKHVFKNTLVLFLRLDSPQYLIKINRFMRCTFENYAVWNKTLLRYLYSWYVVPKCNIKGNVAFTRTISRYFVTCFVALWWTFLLAFICPKNPSGQPSLQLTPYFPGVHSIKKNIYTFVWGFLLSVHVHVNWLTIFRKPLWWYYDIEMSLV